MAQQNGSLGIDTVTLASIFVESVLYGLFIALFISSTVILLEKARKSKSAVNKPLLTASITMFILATIHVGADLRRLLDAFVDSSTHGGPNAILGTVSTPIYILKSTAYGVQTLVGDAFILYRLNLVWNGDKRIVSPILICFIASIGVGIGAIQAFSKAAPDAPVFVASLQKWIVSFFSLSLFTNFSSTVLIAFRIWWTHRKTKNVEKSGQSVLPAMVLIIESGSIYSACLVILLSLYLSGSFAQYILLDAVTQVIGVVFSLVIVRVALGISSESRNTRTKMTTLAFNVSGVGGNTIDDPASENALYDLQISREVIRKEESQVEQYA
ncbi:hypothetical protein HYPSUDRAFT_48489 [Hypholoma sublateritium FD-334 SS-4]|uniref:Uncharacterized protein n=1 Tax=Hypholoma sublateritium (strain FD-334 SS-4) TaxID=945553 RepID=A0A0D2NF43_HYPSF|nr:hypothetical protein HYPSUDRAFT_48489 [Hypholoma sublateritium FD-334 SS-4]